MSSKLIATWLERLDKMVWGPGMLILLLGTGIFLNLRLHFLPIRNLKYAFSCIVTPDSKREQNKGKNSKDSTSPGVSPFAALTTELAATIGTGNIVGVATAMVLGGPGALVWMMLSALVGMATKLVESMLSVKYRRRNDRGEYIGGPMYTLRHAFPFKQLGKILAFFFALFAVLASIGMGNMTQSNSIASAMWESFHVSPAKTGLILTILTILVILGGIQWIGKLTILLVPFMGILYLTGAILVIVRNRANVPAAMLQMLQMAFSLRAVSGGLAGGILVSAKEAIRYGVSRGVFSNEAGLGAAGISAAAANTDNYIKQGYISMTGVFLDTIVICFVTGLAFLSSGLLGSMNESGAFVTGTALAISVFHSSFGKYGVIFITISITLFAFATIASWAYQGEKAFEYLIGSSKYNLFFRLCYALSTFLGAVYSLEMIWNFSDICNALMAIPNLICILVMSADACKEIVDYRE